MKYYLAPMEGLTGYVFRRAYHNHFHNIDKYFTPFIVILQSLAPRSEQSLTQVATPAGNIVEPVIVAILYVFYRYYFYLKR